MFIVRELLSNTYEKYHFVIQFSRIHFIANFKNFKMARLCMVKALSIKNNCDVVELHKNFQNPL